MHGKFWGHFLFLIEYKQVVKQFEDYSWIWWLKGAHGVVTNMIRGKSKLGE